MVRCARCIWVRSRLREEEKKEILICCPEVGKVLQVVVEVVMAPKMRDREIVYVV